MLTEVLTARGRALRQYKDGLQARARLAEIEKQLIAEIGRPIGIRDIINIANGLVVASPTVRALVREYQQLEPQSLAAGDAERELYKSSVAWIDQQIAALRAEVRPIIARMAQLRDTMAHAADERLEHLKAEYRELESQCSKLQSEIAKLERLKLVDDPQHEQ